MEMQCASKFSREHDFERKINGILGVLRTGAQFSSEFSNPPHRIAILNEEIDGILRMLLTGAQFLIRG